MNFSPNFNTKEFERSFNLFYLSIHPHLSSTKTSKPKSFFANNEINNEDEEYKQDNSRVKNIVIYDINKQGQSILFEKVNDTEVITHFLYEEQFDEIEKVITFNKSTNVIRNNKKIKERNMLNLIIVCQLDLSNNMRKIWTFDKYGNNQKLICTIESSYEWQVDVFNQKIRTITRNACLLYTSPSPRD